MKYGVETSAVKTSVIKKKKLKNVIILMFLFFIVKSI